MNDFNCTSCGACCKVIPKEALEVFGLPESPSGGCGHLLPDNTCAIYETRPFICDVRKVWEMKQEMSWEEYKKETHRACETLQQIAGVNKDGSKLADQE